MSRCRLLPAAGEVLLADGRTDEAAALAEELGQIASDFDGAALGAMAAHAAAAVHLAAGQTDRALQSARMAWQAWTHLGAPFETARARVVVGESLLALGDEASELEALTSALRVFEGLGATPHETEELAPPAARP